MRFLQRIYSVYSLSLFAGIFLVLLPAFTFFIYTNNRHPFVFTLHRIWAWAYFTFSFIPVKKIYSDKLDLKNQYIFCSNHFSYLDIPAFGINKVKPIFMGKDSLGKIPLFGFMYRNIHITLDRKNNKSSYNAMSKGALELDKGQNLVIFPEGGILSKQPPGMVRFKDGAFRLAIEKQVPIVPVSIPYNWILLPDDGKLMLSWHRNMIVFHDPINTNGMTIENLNQLKSMTFKIIDEELKKRNNQS